MTTPVTSEELDLLHRQLLPCAHCNASGLLKKRGNSISYWVVRCTVCRANVTGTTALDAVNGWNQRPSSQVVKLGLGTFLLPGNQKWGHVMVHEVAKGGDNVITLTDWQDGELVGAIEVNLGRFFLARWVKQDV